MSRMSAEGGKYHGEYRDKNGQILLPGPMQEYYHDGFEEHIARSYIHAEIEDAETPSLEYTDDQSTSEDAIFSPSGDTIIQEKELLILQDCHDYPLFSQSKSP